MSRPMTLEAELHDRYPAATSKREAVSPKCEAPPLAYTLTDAVAASGLSKSTLYRLAAEGRLRLVKVGGRRLVYGPSLRTLLGGEP